MDKILEFVQFRTFTNTYFFKVTESKVVLKVYDLTELCCKHVWNPASHPSMFADIPRTVHEIRTQPSKFFADVEELEDIPSLEAPQLELSTCQDYIQQAIKELKSKTLLDNEASKQFRCPITLEVFKEPLVLGCGHTFEKAAIEEAAKDTKRCPIDRKPIKSTAPNFGLKSALESWQKEDPIPTFSSFQKNSPSLAKANLLAARAFVEEEEYEQALTSYKTAFQYTKDPKEYAAIPELYKSLGDPEKERLSLLYCALYSLEEDNGMLGITYLEKAKALESKLDPSLLINFSLIMLYSFAKDQGDPKRLIQETTPLLTSTSSKAVFYAQQLLLQDTTNFPLYEKLAELLKDPEEIKQVFLKGVLHATDEKVARSFFEKSFFREDNITFFEDLSLSFRFVLDEQKRIPKEFFGEGESVKQNQLKPLRQLFKALLHYQENPAYYQVIVDSYFEEEKTEKAFAKAINLLPLYIQQRSYDLIQKLSDQVTSKMDLSFKQKIAWYKKLETVYATDDSGQLLQGLGLKDIWEILGEAYETLGDLDAAQAVYKKALNRFSDTSLFTFKLATVLTRQGKVKESVSVYYARAGQAILKQDLLQLDPCYQAIIKIDPQMQHLDGIQKVHLVSQMQILKLTHELKEAKDQIAKIWKRLESTQVPAVAKAKARPVVKSPAPLPLAAFGALKWNQYFGIQVVEPPLPPDIDKILLGPCPIFSGKRVAETHFLTLIPEGMTLERLEALAQNPKQGNKTEFGYKEDSLWDQYGKTPVAKTHWALMTNDVIPDSRSKNWKDQQALATQYRPQGYEIPSVIDAAASLFLEHVQTGKRFYTDNPFTYTRCVEQVKEGSSQWPAAIGGFAPAGLRVDNVDSAFFGAGFECIGLGVVRTFC